MITIFLLASLIILLSDGATSRTLTEIARVEEPTHAAAYEMELNTVEIGRDVRAARRILMPSQDPHSGNA